MLFALLRFKLSVVALAVFICLKSAYPDFTPLAGELISNRKISTLTWEDIIELQEQWGASEVEDSTKLPKNIRLYQIEYYTPDPTGSLITASSLIMVPEFHKPMPLLSLQHATILRRSDAPSTSPDSAEPMVGALMFAARGFTVVLPDGIGLGKSSASYHPFLHALTEGSSARDNLRASLTFFSQIKTPLSGELYIAGYSQGGHWTMALHKELETSPVPLLHLAASAVMGAPLDLSKTMLGHIINKPGRFSCSFAAYLYHAHQKIYPDSLVPINQGFREPYKSRISEIFNGKHGLFYASKKLPKNATELFNDDFLISMKSGSHDKFQNDVAKNDLYDWAPNAKVILIHGMHDEEVPYENSALAYREILKNGGNAELISIKKKYSHVRAFHPSFEIALERFLALEKTRSY